MNMPERVSPRDMLDIIFANRNRSYGAYLLRREYPATMRRALGWGMLLIGSFIFVPQLITALAAALPSENVYDAEYVSMAPPPIEVITPPPPVIETPPPPSRSTIAFPPPLVVTNDQPEEAPTAVDVILDSDAEVSSKTTEGDVDAPPDLGEVNTEVLYVEAPAPKEDNTTYDLAGVQKPPTFPGGEYDLLKFLAENIHYPAMARDAGISGNVAITFVVNKDGSVSDAQVLKDIGGGCGKEAMRVIALMPRWSPGEANSHPVKVRFTLPVRFRLE